MATHGHVFQKNGEGEALLLGHSPSPSFSVLFLRFALSFCLE